MVASTVHETQPIQDEDTLMNLLVRELQEQVKHYDSQHKCAKVWGIQQPTVNYIVNARMDRLTLKQLLGIAWKSGATINIGLSYAN